MSKTIYIGGRLESKEKGNVVTGANAILDDTKGKKQNVINKETDDELLRLEQSKQDNLNFDNAPTENSTNPVTSGGVYTAEKALSDAIEAILLLIPSAATALNKLVDTNTMNSSISTATATFRGTYNVVSDLGLTYQATHAQIEAALDALGLTADNNDFAFVQIPVSDESQDIAKTERFKFNGTNWLYEYDLNTSGFTAAQWAAINSTITLALVQKLAALPTNAELLQALGLKQDVLTFDNAPTTDSNNPVKSGGIKNAIDTAVGDEATARDNADRALSGLIDDEKTRAEGVEGGLNTRLGAVEGSVSTIQGVIPSEATSSNKLVDNASMTTFIGTIIDNIDATFNVTSTDGHVTLAITQVNGVITSVQLSTSDIASAAALTLLAGRVTTAEGNITSLTGRMTTAESDIDTLTALYNALQQSAPQVIEPTDTWPVANPSTTVIYRVIDRVNTPPEYYSDYMWNGTAFVLMATYNNAIDDVPTAGSDNLVKSGGVYEEVSQLGQDLGELELNVNGIKEYNGLLSIGILYPDGKVYSSHDTFRTTEYIFLKSGHKFVSTAINEIYSSQLYPNMCVYADTDDTTLISAISAQSAQGFEYTATQDCYVRFSNSLEKWVAPNIVENNSIESRLDDIEPHVADLVSRLDSIKVYDNVVPYSGNENVGALHNDGKIYPEHTTFRTSDFIQLKRGMSLYSSQKNELVNQQTYPNLCVYSSANENAFIAGVCATQQYGFEYTATQDCYVRFTNLDDYFSFDISDILTPIVHTIEIWIKELYEQGAELKGKKIGFLGDSITANGQYVNAFAEKTGANVVNYGVSGTTIANSSAGQSFIQRVAQMDNDLDIVVVFGGVNDQRLPVPLGTFENRNTDGSLDNTFYGALHTLCRSLFAKYAGKPIIFITPMHNSYRDETYGDTGDINYYEYTTNGLIVENKFPLREKTYIDDSIAVGDVLSKYRKAIIDVCALYSFPVIDMYAISGLFPILEQNSQLYTLDGIHLNTFGGNHIADLMIPKIIELLNL